MNEIRNVIIDSRLRDNGTVSNFTYSLKWPIAQPNSFAVESVQLFNTAYTINDYNYMFYWTDSASVAHNSTLTKGNYTATSLASHIQTIMNTEDTSAGDTYTVTVPSVSGKMTIANDTNNFQLRFNTTTNSVAKTLGFTETAKTGAQTYTGDNVVKLNTRYYLIYGDVGIQNTYSANELTNILAYVPNNVNFGDMIDYQPELAKSFKVTEKELSRLKIYIKDDNGNLVDLNGVDWSMNIIVSIKN